jgi:CRISPR/Cas system CMR-associated protein Cmr5 small subunit
MPSQTLKQLRLEHAWTCASAAKEKLGGDYDSYIDAVKNLPAQITGNGLGQALAYLAAEGLGSPEGHLYRHVESWLTDRSELEDADAPKGSYAERPDGENDGARTKLIYRIAQESSTTCRRGTSEALDYLAVLRFAAGAVKVGPFDSAERGDTDDEDRPDDETDIASPDESSRTA